MEKLLCHPDLFFKQGGGEDDLDTGLHRLVSMKRAVRLQQLKGAGSFPTAESLLKIEVEYGEFMTNEELEGRFGDASLDATRPLQQDSPRGLDQTLNPNPQRSLDKASAKRLTLGPRWQHT
mmetsp:Transcript_43395/g.77987  ORF Transcript_43395/g.77987 Transcript_43395/m.77987 type:complete len:121 (-) Transcript_43395:3-365(-)